MESSSKRRKTDHGGSDLRSSGLIDFKSPGSARLSTASTFVLKTDELLKEAKVDYASTLADVDKQLHRLKEIVDSISPHGPVPISEATAQFERKQKITIPYPDPKPATDTPYQLSYAKPSQYNVVGSYVSKTMAKSQPRTGIDMVLQMPKSLFQDKDYMNLRYFYRRSYFIAYIAAHIRKEMADSMDLRFECLNENPLLPILAIRPKSSSDAASTEKTNGKPTKATLQQSPYRIRLIPCAPDNLFPWSKLSPSSCCHKTSNGEQKKASQPTPFYNSTLNAEKTFISYLRVHTLAKNECPGFTDACVLGRIWLQQRGFGSDVSQGGFGHFEWATMIALLMQSGKGSGQAALSTSLSSTELFKAAIQFLSTTEFSRKPFVFRDSSVSPDSVKEAGPVMFDPAREVNILFKMTQWSAQLLQIYAKSTADLLADESADKFAPTFITKANDALEIFDAVFEIKTPDMVNFASSADRKGAVWDFSSEAHKVLKKAFGNRAQLVHLHKDASQSWPLSGSIPTEATKVLVGVVFDAANMPQQMEHGPSAEDQKEAARFRQFWGEKAELRRFKNGSILECVEWSSKQAFQICEEITQYVLKRHMKVIASEITSFGAEFGSITSLSHLDKTAFDSARQAFQTFERDIRSLEDLPLQIRQLSMVSPLARYASIEPPMLGFHKGAIEPIDVNLYFEASSKWPENLTGIQETKIEFLLDIDRRLAGALENITTALGRENKDLGIEGLAYLDVVYTSGAAFRLRIHSDLEETLLQRQVLNKTLDHQVRDEAAQALVKFNWLYTTLPLHNQTVATFCTRLPCLSPTIRLVKHWFNSHKLAGHIREELIEMFVLHVFLQPYPWMIPSSVTTGFLRTLVFLSKWDWREEPLIVDSAESLTVDERSTIHHSLESLRKRDPHMNQNVLVVATSHDTSGLAYTRDGPSKLVASRLTRLAKAACALVRDEGIHLNPSRLFEAALQDYDVLIHLSAKAVKSVLRDAATEGGIRKHSQFKNLDDRTFKVPLPLRAHPVDVLIAELQRAYQDTLLFFRGASDDTVIAAIWDPRLQATQRFRAGLPYNFRRLPGQDGDLVEVNQQAVLLEIARAGGDLVKKIQVDDGK